MKPLQKHYQMFVILCILPFTKSINRWLRLFTTLTSIICLFIEFISFMASLVFVINNFSIDFVNAICAYHQIVGSLIAIFSLLTAYIKRDNLKKTFDDFQTFYDSSKSINLIWNNDTIYTSNFSLS